MDATPTTGPDGSVFRRRGALAAVAALWAVGHAVGVRAASYEHLGELADRLDALDAGVAASAAVGGGSLGISGGGVGYLAVHALPRALGGPLGSLQLVYAGLDALALGVWLWATRGWPPVLRWGVALLAAGDPGAKVWLVENSTLAGLAALPLAAALAASRPRLAMAAAWWAAALHLSTTALFLVPAAAFAFRDRLGRAALAFGAAAGVALAPAAAGLGQELQGQAARLAPALTDDGGRTLGDVVGFLASALGLPAVLLALVAAGLARRSWGRPPIAVGLLGLLGCVLPLAVVDRGGFGEPYRLAVAMPFAWLVIAGAAEGVPRWGRALGLAALVGATWGGRPAAPTPGEPLESGAEGCRRHRIAQLREAMPDAVPWGATSFVGAQSVCLRGALSWERHRPEATAVLLPPDALPGGMPLADLRLHPAVVGPPVALQPRGGSVELHAPAGPPLLVAFRRGGQREGPVRGPVLARCDLEAEEPGVPEHVCSFEEGWLALAASSNPRTIVFEPPPGEASARVSVVGSWALTDAGR